MHKLNPIKKNGVAHYGATPALSFLIIILFSFGLAQNNIFVAGATPAATTNNSTAATTTINNNLQPQNNSYAQTNAPDYCQTPANQSRPECQVTPTTTGQPINTQSNGYYPAYCITPVNQSRPECSQYSTNSVTPIGPVNAPRPDYCRSSQYQHLAECNPIVLNRPPSPPIQLICSDPSNFRTPLCQEFFTNQPFLPEPSTPVQIFPSYCQAPSAQLRPECMIQVTPNYPQPRPPQFCPPGVFDPFCIPEPRPCAGPYDPLCTPQFPPYIQPPFVPTPPYIPTPPTICDPNYPPINCIQPPRPCIVGTFDPLCNTSPIPQTPICPPGFMPAPMPLGCVPDIQVTPPFDPNHIPPPPPPCPIDTDGMPGIDCVDESDFALPLPPENSDCQTLRRSNSDRATVTRACSPIYFTYPNAYPANAPIAIHRANQDISFVFRSPFSGGPYFFGKTTDGKIQQLHSVGSEFWNNPPVPPYVSVYDQIEIPYFANMSSFKINGALVEVFAIVLTKPPSTNPFLNISSMAELDGILVNLGKNEGSYHGFVSVPLLPLNF